MYRVHNHCRACGYGKAGAPGIKAAEPEQLQEAFDLGVQPLANDFCDSTMEHAGYAPLKVLYCPRCSLGQLSVVVRPDILYTNYRYLTSGSDMMQAHFERLIQDIGEESNLRTVLEIGSNDGRFLISLRRAGFKARGVDPAANLARIANLAGLDTACAFFTAESAQHLGTADIVIARHVFAHVDDWQDFIKALETVSHPMTLVCIETP